MTAAHLQSNAAKQVVLLAMDVISIEGLSNRQIAFCLAFWPCMDIYLSVDLLVSVGLSVWLSDLFLFDIFMSAYILSSASSRVWSNCTKLDPKETAYQQIMAMATNQKWQDQMMVKRHSSALMTTYCTIWRVWKFPPAPVPHSSSKCQHSYLSQSVWWTPSSSQSHGSVLANACWKHLDIPRNIRNGSCR